MLKVLITGGRGHVGTAIRRQLADLPATWTDLAELDAMDEDAVRRAVAGHDQLLHLANSFRVDGYSPDALFRSLQMVDVVLAEALTAGVKRVILISSVHATQLDTLQAPPLWTIASSPLPSTPYGLTRLEVEEKGEAASRLGLDVICIRLGGVAQPDRPARARSQRHHWLSHEDCASMFRACLTAPIEAGRYTSFYAVSDLPERIFATDNPFGWAPQTRRVGLRRHVRHQVVRLKCLVSTLLGRSARPA